MVCSRWVGRGMDSNGVADMRRRLHVSCKHVGTLKLSFMLSRQGFEWLFSNTFMKPFSKQSMCMHLLFVAQFIEIRCLYHVHFWCLPRLFEYVFAWHSTDIVPIAQHVNMRSKGWFGESK